MIGRLRRMFAQPGFAGLMAALGLMAVNWPFLEIARGAGNFILFGYLFGFWCLLVLFAYLISRAVSDEEADGGEDV